MRRRRMDALVGLEDFAGLLEVEDLAPRVCFKSADKLLRGLGEDYALTATSRHGWGEGEGLGTRRGGEKRGERGGVDVGGRSDGGAGKGPGGLVGGGQSLAATTLPLPSLPRPLQHLGPPPPFSTSSPSPCPLAPHHFHLCRPIQSRLPVRQYILSNQGPLPFPYIFNCRSHSSVFPLIHRTLPSLRCSKHAHLPCNHLYQLSQFFLHSTVRWRRPMANQRCTSVSRDRLC